MHMLYFLYSFICQQTQVDSKYCMLWKILQWTWNCRYLFRIWYLFHFIWLYTEKQGFGSYCSLGLNFLWNVHLIFQNDYTNVYSHQKYTRVLLHKIIPVILYYFDKSHFNRHEIIPYCDFDLPFPDDLWCICVSSFEKCLFSSFDHFLIGLDPGSNLSLLHCRWILYCWATSKSLQYVHVVTCAYWYPQRRYICYVNL